MTIYQHKFNDRTPYTYLIGWSQLDIWYYGVRFAKDCHPDDLWIDYHTSSDYVDLMVVECGDPDIIEVRHIFETGNLERAINSARRWEKLCIRRLSMVRSERFLNKKEPDEQFYCTGHSEETKALLSRIKSSPESIERQRRTCLEKYGVTNSSLLPENRKRAKEAEKVTLLERYGVNHNMQIPGVVERMIESRDATMIERYGVKNALQVPEIAARQLESRTKYWIDNFGVSNPHQVPEIIQKQKDTMLELYGVTTGLNLKAFCEGCGQTYRVCHKRYHLKCNQEITNESKV